MSIRFHSDYIPGARYGWTRCIETVADAKDAAYDAAGVARSHGIASFDTTKSAAYALEHHLLTIRENRLLLDCLDAIEALAQAEGEAAVVAEELYG